MTCTKPAATDRSARRGKRLSLALLAGVGLAGAAPQAAQAGFLEQLFGIQPAPDVQRPAVQVPSFDYRPRHIAPRPQRRRVFVETIGSGKQTPTDLMHDKTLRRGDAVMMKDGLHIYAGAWSAPSHVAGDFTPLDRSGLPAKEKVILAAVDTTRASVAEKDAGAAGSLASGRSAAVSAPVAEGRLIVDPRGSRIRYVGP